MRKHNPQGKKTVKGFTLVDLLVGMAITSIFLVGSILSFVLTSRNINASVSQARAMNLVQTVESFVLSHDIDEGDEGVAADKIDLDGELVVFIDNGGEKTAIASNSSGLIKNIGDKYVDSCYICSVSYAYGDEIRMTTIVKDIG